MTKHIRTVNGNREYLMLKLFSLLPQLPFTHFTRQSINLQVIKTLVKVLLANEYAFTSFFSVSRTFMKINKLLSIHWKHFNYYCNRIHTNVAIEYTIHFNYYFLPMISHTKWNTKEMEKWLTKANTFQYQN